jgi:GLPGLI family protein
MRVVNLKIALKMKMLLCFLCALFYNNLNAQDYIFNGKIEYAKETKNLSGEYVVKSNGESHTYFNKDYYLYQQSTTLDVEKQIDRLIKLLPKEAGELDSFELKRQRVNLKKQLEDQLSKKLNPISIVNYSQSIAYKPKIIGDINYCLVDTLGKIDWQLLNDTLTIEGLLCQKAKGWFVGKYYFVWFAPQIAFPAGPLNMHGLPGIIVLATSEDEKTRYRMKKLEYPLAETIKFSGCGNAKKIDNFEFMQLQAKQMEKMKHDMEEAKNNVHKKKN